MVFASSSPVLYPQSSSPPQAQPKKRKLFQSFVSEPTLKKTKVVGGFEVDIDEADEDDNDANDDNGNGNSAKIDNEEGSDQQPGEQHRSPSPEPIDPDDTNPATLKQFSQSTRPASPTVASFSRPLLRKRAARSVPLETSSGETIDIPVRSRTEGQTYESIIAERSKTKEGRAKTAYYGIEIHKLIDDARLQRMIDENERLVEKQRAEDQSYAPSSSHTWTKPKAHLLWTEKYRARKFTDLVGDERTHRQVLRWLKAWDPIVFPSFRRRSKPATKIHRDGHNKDDEEKAHRKILLLTGPPGLGKTTLAHVCARQAGYEVLEINASDDRSRDVVKGCIKDALGTETVRGIQEPGGERRIGRPVCVVVDEVDGVVTGSGGSGEGGFMKALIDLVQLDQRNSGQQHTQGQSETAGAKKKKKGEKFRMLRPLILICNDVYAPSMRPLRTSSIAEIVQVRKPALEKVIMRLKNVFEQERIPCDTDAVRRICASAWGLGARQQGTMDGHGTGEGDIRSVLVNAEWIAHKFRASEHSRLTRKWVEAHLAASHSSSSSNGAAKGLGRGGVREVVDRIFTYGAGLPSVSGTTALSAEDARLVSECKTTAIGISDLHKRAAISHLREMIDQCGEYDRVMTDCFATYPLQVYQDDVRLTKPNQGYDWLYFHDSMSARVFSSHEWELLPYLNTGACGFHDLFAGVDFGIHSGKNWADGHGKKEDGDQEEAEGGSHPFAGVKADFAANEAEKANRTLLAELQDRFQPELLRMFSSIDNIATELVPHAVGRMMAPDVKPVVVGGSGSTASVASVRKDSEKRCVKNSVRVMHALDVRFEKVRVELEVGAAGPGKGGFAYRMEPPLDILTSFHLDSTKKKKNSTAPGPSSGPVRYAVRQVLDQELRKEKALRAAILRQSRSTALLGRDEVTSNSTATANTGGGASGAGDEDKENKAPTRCKLEQLQRQQQDQENAASKIKRDFFGRVITNNTISPDPGLAKQKTSFSAKESAGEAQGVRVWVSFHEGFSNAVRKPITLKELMEGFA